MATGRIGVTPTLRTRWSKQPTAGTTSLSGLDDNSVSLVYDVGYEAVYRNGTLLSRGNDYTATNGTTVTLIDATLAGDIIEILANQLVPLSDAISKGQYNAKGALLSATAASTPGVLAVGSNAQVLTADSTTSTGLKWATPSAGGITLLSTTTLSGASTTVSSIDQTYTNLYVVMSGFYTSGGAQFTIKPNASNAIGNNVLMAEANLSTLVANTNIISPGVGTNTSAGDTVAFLNILNYSSTTITKPFDWYGNSTNAVNGTWMAGGSVRTTSAISSLVFAPASGTWSGGTITIYGVK